MTGSRLQQMVAVEQEPQNVVCAERACCWPRLLLPTVVCAVQRTFRGFGSSVLGPDPDGIRRRRIVKARATTCGKTGFGIQMTGSKLTLYDFGTDDRVAN